MSAEPTLTERADDPSSGAPAHAETTAIEANVVSAQVEETQSRDDDVDEWFAQAATTYVSDNDDTPEHERLSAATLPVHGALVRPPRPKRGLMCTLTARPRRALTLATFALVIVVIIDIRLVSSQTTTVTAPVNTTDTSASIDKLGDTVDRRLKHTIARQQHADTQRRTQARRRHASARRKHAKATVVGDTPPRRGPHSRQEARTWQARCGTSGCTPRPVPTRQREAAPRRSICGPFDLC